MKKLFSYFPFLSLLFLLLLIGCVSPIEPEFEFKEGLIFIDAFASTVPGESFVKLTESRVDGFKYSTELIEDADVTFYNAATNTTIQLAQGEDSYNPPHEFIVYVGESWQLNVVLSNGSRYSSLIEKVIEPVAIDAVDVGFDPQLIFRDDSEVFVPGHALSVSFQDPPNSENFYYWRFTSYETLVVCEQCTGGAFREDECIDIPNDINRRPYFTYLCNDDCWRIRFNEDIKIFSDEFTNGSVITSLPIANVLLYSKEDILVEIQQFSLSASAYNYYKVLEDIVNNSGSFNAPPPAALIGNLFNVDDSQEYVLGRFTAAAATTKSIFIDRLNIDENVIENRQPLLLENSPDPLVEPVTSVECKESRERTKIAPTGWVEN